MRLPFLRPKSDDARPPSRLPPAPGDDATALQAARTRARQRLVGALVLLAVGVLTFPLLFETQPRPVGVDTPISPPRDAGAAARPGARAPLPVLPAEASVEEPVAAASDAARRAAAAAPPGGSASAGGTAATPTAAPAPDRAPAAVVAAAPASAPASASTQTARAVPVPAPSATPAPAPAPTALPGSASPRAPVAATPAAASRPAAVVAAPPAATMATATPAAARPASAAAPAAASSAGAARFVVQVGAYSEARALRDARQKVESLGLKTYTQVIENDAGKRTRVRVGPFDTRAEADAAARKLKAGGMPANILTL
jgi:DedD protein